MWFLVDHPEITEFRRTKDVDVVVAVPSYNEFAALENRLRAEGFRHDVSEDAPICRWIVDSCRVDIMPEKPAHLSRNFNDSLQGHTAEKNRVPIVKARFDAIAALGG
jgi:GrpB-like predicted nucleotidyltransferase (UPF0157 family)